MKREVKKNAGGKRPRPNEFPQEVIEEAQRVASEPIRADGRLDLRKKFIFTCDPVTARDYDDALSLDRDRQGNRVLGIHIADVSHYVRPGGALDREAYRRSTSIYLCDRVIPMLPELLSNGVCSLVPGEDRLAFSVFLTFDKKGELTQRTFTKSIIRSKARYTYEQVMAVLEGRPVPTAPIPAAQAKVIRAIGALAQELRNRRFAAGALDLAIPEPQIVLDEDGEMTGIVIHPYDESHQMVEECMVAANEAVAKELWTKGIRILSRLHEPPDDEKLLLLRAELRGLGVKMGNITQPKVFAKFLQEIKRHPLYPTISVMILRSMKRAVYDAKTIGHFGLAKKYYAHFTSPIRRYPDLTLHRQLGDYIAGGHPRRPPALLAKWAEHVTECEQLASDAEREQITQAKFDFIEKRLKQDPRCEYDAVIEKCAPFGCFVVLPEWDISGLVHISQLSRRYVTYNESDGTLSAGGGERWRISDKLRVRIARVDAENRHIDFVPVRSRRGNS